MMNSPTIDRLLDECAADQHGVLTPAQARSLGISRNAISSRRRTGRLRNVLPGVYGWSAAARTLTSDGKLMAATLVGGPGAAISHLSAARHLDVWSRLHHGIHIVSATCTRVPCQSNIVLHRLPPLRPDEILLVRNIPTTEHMRMCCDLGAVLTPYQLANVLYELAYRQVLDLDRLRQLIVRRGAFTGIQTVQRAIALYLDGSAGTRSRSEDRLVHGLQRGGFPPFLVNVRGATCDAGREPDVTWRERKVVVEVDGSGHDRPGVSETDRLSDEQLHRMGWIVLRFSSDRIWTDLPGVLVDIRCAVRC